MIEINENSITLKHSRTITMRDLTGNTSLMFLASSWPDKYIIIEQDTINYTDPHIHYLTLDRIKEEYGEVVSNFIKEVL